MNHYTDMKHAIVTGGGSGLGRAFCIELARQGWHVAIVDLDPEGAQETYRIVQQHGSNCQVEIMDVAVLPHWEALVARLRGQWPRIDLLINNAGICGAGMIGNFSSASLTRILEVNLLGAIHGCQCLVPWFKECAPGVNIVNIASLAAVISAPSMAAYSISKSGVVTLSETLYNELHQKGVGVTVVLPGFFASNLLENGCFDDMRLRMIAEEYTQHAEFTAEDVVALTFKAVERGQLYVMLGRRTRIAAKLKRLAPSWFLRVVAKTFFYDLERVHPARS